MTPPGLLPRLNVPVNTALQLIRDLIADGQMLLANYARGAHNPQIALSHRVKVTNWSRAAEDRINSLFNSPVFLRGGLRTLSGDSLDIAQLEHLLTALSPPTKILPLEPTPPAGFTIVAESRIDQLRALPGENFDFSKLIRLCEELNTAYANGCFFASIMITRAILDHVPPVFGARDFTNVASQHPGPKSFKKAMEDLDSNARNIADLHLHGQIRKPESTPTPQQVNFSQGLDLLLSEIVRISSPSSRGEAELVATYFTGKNRWTRSP